MGRPPRSLEAPVKLAALCPLLLVAACGVEPGAPQVQVGVNALTLPAVTNAVYDLTVKNDVGEVVWTARVDTLTYGDGRGSVTYVGPCDADDNDGDGRAPNTVELTVVDLPPLKPDEWSNPTANGPLVQVAECVENSDTRVDFNLSILRSAEQGFFDIAVSFDDIFCSAKLDCADDAGQPIDLLHDPQQGGRAPTLVMGFSCTAGPGSGTVLHMSDVVVSCKGGETYVVDPGLEGIGPGAPPLLFADLVLRGAELLPNADKAYWNVALGIDTAVLGQNGTHTDCRFRAAATASDGSIPEGSPYPYVAWDVPLNTTGGLSCTQHPLNGGNGVSVAYSDALALPHSYQRPTGPTVP